MRHNPKVRIEELEQEPKQEQNPLDNNKFYETICMTSAKQYADLKIQHFNSVFNLFTRLITEHAEWGASYVWVEVFTYLHWEGRGIPYHGLIWEKQLVYDTFATCAEALRRQGFKVECECDSNSDPKYMVSWEKNYNVQS